MSEAINKRYPAQKPTATTRNKSYEKWHEIFPDSELAGALLDRPPEALDNCQRQRRLLSPTPPRTDRTSPAPEPGGHLGVSAGESVMREPAEMSVVSIYETGVDTTWAVPGPAPSTNTATLPVRTRGPECRQGSNQGLSLVVHPRAEAFQRWLHLALDGWGRGNAKELREACLKGGSWAAAHPQAQTCVPTCFARAVALLIRCKHSGPE